MLGGIIARSRIWLSRRRGVLIGQNCRLMGMPHWGSEPYLISIGDFVTIAGNVTFINHDGGTWVFRRDPQFAGVIKYGRIAIGNNCFIGYGAILLPGTEIGTDCVIGAGSVVSGKIPKRTVAAGIPAKPIMTYEEYADRCLKRTPEYDKQHYRADKQAELLRLFPPSPMGPAGGPVAPCP